MSSHHGVVLVGPQGVGKSALAELLAKHRSEWPQIETGAILRLIKNGHWPHPDRARISQLMDSGELIPDDIVMGIAHTWLAEHRSADGHVYNGLPRNLDQAKELRTTWEELGLRPPRLILINASRRVIEQRVLGRRICTEVACGAIYNIFFHPPKDAGRCDKCGSDLYQRADDKPEPLRRRLDDFYAHTLEALEWLRSQGLDYHEINGEQPLGEVEEDALKIILNGNRK